jgi:hypothetical protein
MWKPPIIAGVDLTQDNGQWSMTYNGQTYGPGHYPSISVGSGQYADFTFTIKKGADFDLSGPVSVAKGNAKPNGNGLYSQVTVTDVQPTVLAFHDKNTEKTDLNYVLHFKDGSTLDPIIKNGGGCCQVASTATGTVTLSNSSFIAYLALAFFVGAAVVLVARWLAGRSRNPA